MQVKLSFLKAVNTHRRALVHAGSEICWESIDDLYNTFFKRGKLLSLCGAS
jgi:hypothetical protein